MSLTLKTRIHIYLFQFHWFREIRWWLRDTFGPHFMCPVCGWPKLHEDPTFYTYEICPSCGVEFGYDNPDDYSAYRADWLTKGEWWAGTIDRCPKGWDPEEQLKNLEKKS